jgi:biopolymer transport protein ExbB
MYRMPRKVLTIFAALNVGFELPAIDVALVAAGAQQDLAAALTELAELRKAVESERLPLSREITTLEQSVITRRAELMKSERFQENQLVELNALKAEARRRMDESKFAESLLTEYARALRSRLHFIEEPRYAERFDAADKAGSSPELSLMERLQARAGLLDVSFSRIEAALGGELIEARAFDPRGLLIEGRAAVVGPVTVFASADGAHAGPLQQELNRSEPTVVHVGRGMTEATRTLIATGSGELAVDPTLGNAFKLAALKETLFEKIAKGGWAMVPLLALGLAALGVGSVKWTQLTRFRMATEGDLQAVLNHIERGEPERAVARARAIAGPAGLLLTTAAEHADEKKEYIEEILYERMLYSRAKLERGIPFLALTATAAPLMGLLGTVMGMIATFKLISSFGSGDPKVLAAGISEALVATATGMIVAIPALLLHAFLSRKAKGIIGSMEQLAVGFINGIPAADEADYPLHHRERRR